MSISTKTAKSEKCSGDKEATIYGPNNFDISFRDITTVNDLMKRQNVVY